MNWLILDIATAPIADADTYLDGAISAPSNYKDPVKIADYITEKRAERLADAALDVDLARLTGIGIVQADGGSVVTACKTEEDERQSIAGLAYILKSDPHRMCQIITFGGHNFDLPMIMRRARYLSVPFPVLNLDRWKSPHADLCELLSDRDPRRRRGLGFYARRLGWSDITKPLSGAEESKVHETDAWGALEASIQHDLTATYRLAKWLGIISEQEPLL